MFQRSFAVAKEVRTATDIGAQSVSMAAAAVRLASNLFEDLGQIRVLLIGAGDMITLTGTHFAARQPKQMVVANRTASSAFGGGVGRRVHVAGRAAAATARI